MKTKLLLSLALLCTSFISNAQFATGQKLLGGQASFYTNKNYTDPATAETRNLGFELTPALSRFSSPTVMNTFGIGYGYGSTSNKIVATGSVIKNRANNYSLFYARTKLNRIANNFYFTYAGRIAAGFGNTQLVPATGPTVTTGNNWGAGIGGNLGLLYKMNDRFVFTCNLNNVVALNYSHMKSNGLGTPVYNNSFSFTSGLGSLSLNSLSIGAMYMLK